MRVIRFLTCIGILAISTPALSADYHRPRRDAFDAPPVYVGFPAPKPIYWVAAPPQYIQDLRTGRPGYWTAPQPSFLDRLFGERNGY